MVHNAPDRTHRLHSFITIETWGISREVLFLLKRRNVDEEKVSKISRPVHP